MTAPAAPPATTPGHPGAKGKGMSAKLGPFPIWVWVVGVGGVALFVIQSKKKKAATANPNTATLDAPTSALAPADPFGYGTGAYGTGLGGGAGTAADGTGAYGTGLGGGAGTAANGQDPALLAALGALQHQVEALSQQQSTTKAGAKDHATNQTDFSGYQVMAAGKQVTLPADYAKALNTDPSGQQWAGTGAAAVPFYNNVPLSIIADGTHPDAEAAYQASRAVPAAPNGPGGTFVPGFASGPLGVVAK